MHADTPITDAKEDLFDRGNYAKQMARYLCLPPGAHSIVVGLRGRWGEGKTSCINMIKQELAASRDKPIVLDFAPWLITTLDSVLEGFLIQLAVALGRKGRSKAAKESAHKLVLFAKMLSPIKLIPGVEPWGSMVEGVLSSIGDASSAGAELSSLDLQARKEDVQKQIEKIKRPIVVFIDDVDRLPPEQVRTVFQVLKAVGDFNRVSYLVAYDPEPVCAALSYKKTYDGAKYLEKIVQVSCPVPRLGFYHKYVFIEKQIKAILDALHLELSEEEMVVLQEALNHTELVRAMRSPRDIVRLMNHVRFIAAGTRDEVCFADVLVFEALPLLFPDVAQYVKEHPGAVVQAKLHDLEVAPLRLPAPDMITASNMGGTNKKSEIETLLDTWPYEGPNREYVKSLLLFCFPKLGNRPARIEAAMKMQTRIQNRDALLKMLQCGVTGFTFSQHEARLFFENPSQRERIWEDMRHEGRLEGWVLYLTQAAATLDVIDCESLFTLLQRTLDNDPTKGKSYRCARLMTELPYAILGRVAADKPQRWAAFCWLLKNPDTVVLGEHVLLFFLADYGLWKDERYFETVSHIDKKPEAEQPFSFEELRQAKDLWLGTLRTTAAGGRDITDVGVLHRWGQLNNNDYGEVQKYLMSRASKIEWLQAFAANNGGILEGVEKLVEDRAAFCEHLRILPDQNDNVQRLLRHLSEIGNRTANPRTEEV